VCGTSNAVAGGTVCALPAAAVMMLLYIIMFNMMGIAIIMLRPIVIVIGMVMHIVVVNTTPRISSLMITYRWHIVGMLWLAIVGAVGALPTATVVMLMLFIMVGIVGVLPGAMLSAVPIPLPSLTCATATMSTMIIIFVIIIVKTVIVSTVHGSMMFILPVIVPPIFRFV
jgi:hypothetical protein